MPSAMGGPVWRPLETVSGSSWACPQPHGSGRVSTLGPGYRARSRCRIGSCSRPRVAGFSPPPGLRVASCSATLRGCDKPAKRAASAPWENMVRGAAGDCFAAGRTAAVSPLRSCLRALSVSTPSRSSADRYSSAKPSLEESPAASVSRPVPGRSVLALSRWAAASSGGLDGDGGAGGLAHQPCGYLGLAAVLDADEQHGRGGGHGGAPAQAGTGVAVRARSRSAPTGECANLGRGGRTRGVCARRTGQAVVTSDPGDLRHLDPGLMLVEL